MANDDPGAIVGRDGELDHVQAFLDDLPGGPAGLVRSGAAGIGKTMLWHAGVEQARECFAHGLTCRGAQAEAALSFAGLSELLTVQVSMRRGYQLDRRATAASGPSAAN